MHLVPFNEKSGVMNAFSIFFFFFFSFRLRSEEPRMRRDPNLRACNPKLRARFGCMERGEGC